MPTLLLSMSQKTFDTLLYTHEHHEGCFKGNTFANLNFSYCLGGSGEGENEGRNVFMVDGDVGANVGMASFAAATKGFRVGSI